MIRYKCTSCGVRLESSSELSGQEDTCPSCGHICVVPAVRNICRPLVWCCVVLTVAAVTVILSALDSEDSQTNSPQTGPRQSYPQAVRSPINVEYLKEASPLVGGSHMGGYYAWILTEPLTKPDLERLGHDFVARMKRHRGNHLKLWVHFTRPSPSTFGHCAVWLNATSYRNYELSMFGVIPDSLNPEGLYEAYLRGNHMVSGRSRGGEYSHGGKNPIECEYKPDDGEVIFHDAWLWTTSTQTHMPAIILAIIDNHLPEGGYGCWPTIPGLKRVVVHVYAKQDPKPIVTVSYDRRAHDASIRLNKILWDKRFPLDGTRFEAAQRYRAHVMSLEEYRALCDGLAMQIYKLYENDWVKLFPMLEVRINRKLGAAPSDFCRRYFFGVE